jgi:hypothetical protein
MADLIAKAKRILQAVDLYHEAPNSSNRTELRRVIHDELESAGMAAIRELENIVKAKRFDRETFDDDTAFADWAQNRARHTLARCAASTVGGVAVDRHQVESSPATHGSTLGGKVLGGGNG